MTTLDTSAPVATHPWTYWLGWALSGLIILFFLVDGAIKLVPLDVVNTTLRNERLRALFPLSR